MKKISNGYKTSIIFLIQWLISSISAGIIGSILVALFYYILIISGNFFLSTKIPIPIWSLCGAAILGVIIYPIYPSASGEGIPSYINGVLKHRAQHPTGMKSR